MVSNYFAWYRIKALFFKEFHQMLRDPIIFVSAIIFPLAELIFFALLFNVNPRDIPTVVLAAENTQITRSFIQSLTNTGYFKITQQLTSEAQAEHLLKQGKIQFILNIPPGFTRNILRGNKPNLLLIADAANPLAVTAAIAAAAQVTNHAFIYDFVGTLNKFNIDSPSVNLIVQQRYNPLAISQYYSIPGLISLILLLVLLMLSATSIAKERNEGSMESLLTTPAHPLEVMASKMIPYLLFGYIQIFLIFIIAKVAFGVPFVGSYLLFMVAVMPLMISGLGVGLICSANAPNESEAMQLASYFFALSVLFSGFLFPFQGMPTWAQWIGNLLPLTHFIRITLGIMLKGNNFFEIWPDLWPIIIFMLVAFFTGTKCYKQTLD